MDKTVRAAGIRGFGELMQSHNAEPEPLLQSVGIPLAALTDDELRISLTAVARLLEQSARLIDCPDIGLRMAKQQDISILGPIAIAMQNAATVGEGIAVCARFLHTHSPGIRLTLHPNEPQAGRTALRLTIVVPNGVVSRQVTDQSLADLYNFIAWLAQERPPVVAIHLPHTPLAEPACYETSFNCLPAFEQAHAEIHLPNEFFQHDISGASEAFHQMSVDYLQLRYAPNNQTVSERVEAILRRALSSTRGRREIVANLLSMHPRTLQRRLAAEGRSYQEILDLVRRAEIHRWLVETDTPLIQIASLVGLADQTVLTRNCRRWFGATPGKIRAGGGLAER